MPAKKVTIQEAAARLPELLERVRGGEEVIIADNDEPMAKLTPVRQKREPRSFGGYEGRIRMSQDFDDCSRG